MNRLVVGLTGILGSGKTTAAKLLAARGAAIVDMDEAGRWVVEHSKHVRDEIRTAFGAEVFDVSDQLLRKKLGEIVFSDAVALVTLNKIVHPAMLERVRFLLNQEKAEENGHYIIVDAALLFELDFDKECDVIVTVTAPLEICLKRAEQKNLTTPQAMDRIKSQWPQEEKAARSDYIILNDTTRSEFEKRVFALHMWLMQKTKK